MKSGLLTALAALFASQTVAAPSNLATMTLGYSYFNRPGADMAAHDADVKACASEASKTQSIDEAAGIPAPTGKPLQDAIAGIVSAELSLAYHHGVVGASLENCMVVRGWRVVLVPEEIAKPYAALSQKDLSNLLSGWVGAENPPHGIIVRSWANEAASGSTVRFAMRPAHTNEGQLSLKAATGGTLTQFDSVPADDAEVFFQTGAVVAKPIKPDGIASAPADAAILVVGVKGNGASIHFQRVGKDPSKPASLQDDRVDTVIVSTRRVQGKSGLMVVAVPSGQWRIESFVGARPLAFCLGAPSFTLKPGQVVYAGTFDLAGEDLGPDLSLDSPRAFLGNQAASGALAAAEYRNGSLGACGGGAIFALEIKGAPFEPGYAWGGAAPQTVSLPPAK